MRYKQKGFTLIELLVVVSIIGLLASVVLVALGSSRTKSRDAKRVGDVRQMLSALELYYTTCSNYPSSLVTTTSNGCPAGTTLASFMPQIPTNPSPGGTAYTYTATPASCSGTACTGFSLTFTLEGTTGSLSSGLRTAGPTGIQ